MDTNLPALIPRQGLVGDSGLIPVAEYMRMSTDHQRYSVEFQCGVIRKYAVNNGMSIVRTYIDDAKSGLTLSGRFGLQSLLEDVHARRADFSAVLVYDVSRWGRFQNSDEAAYYEFLCKRAGVTVIYCAEVFDDSPMGGMFKNMKRYMAGEFSRGQSVRVWGAQAQTVAAGFRPGGVAGYGLRRMRVSPDGQLIGILMHGEYKALTSDRVILVPGPRHEVETVWWIYDSFALDMKSPKAIAAELNECSEDRSIIWTRQIIIRMLAAPKYAGDNVFNRTSLKLKAKKITNPESLWVRRDGAFRGLVSREYFAYVAEITTYRKTKKKFEDVELKAQLKALLRKHGRLTSWLIRDEPGMAVPATFMNRFGTMEAAYREVGYCTLRRCMTMEWKILRQKRIATLVEEVTDILASASVGVEWDSKFKVIKVHGREIAVEFLWCQTYLEERRWRVKRIHGMSFAEYLIVRMDRGTMTVFDILLFPAAALSTFPKNVISTTTPSVKPYAIADIHSLAAQWTKSGPGLRGDNKVSVDG